ncbi:hypothetical protein [Streptomyces griseoaurantiacus]|uniref:hypothetical protein n=1 Tax=Streptomyces griseoaurantiacus TaxID=68213 RepID=UPI003249309A
MNPQHPHNPQDPRQGQSPQYPQPPVHQQNPGQPPYPQYQQQPGWGTPPPMPQPPRRNTGRIVGFSCLGVLALFVVLGIVVAAVGGGDDDGKKSTASSSQAEDDSAKDDTARSDAKNDTKSDAEDDKKDGEGDKGDAKSTGSQADRFKACVAKKGTAGEKAAVAHVTKVTGTDKRNDILDAAEVFTDFTGGFMSADAGDAKLITSAFTSCYESDNGLVTVYGSDGDMITNGNY